MDRVFDRLEQLYAISPTRVGDSAEEDAAHRLAAHWMREAGLEVDTDGAGNTLGRRGDGRVWIGSHLDSVPDGGRFDGVLGVVAGLELAEIATTGIVARTGSLRCARRNCQPSRVGIMRSSTTTSGRAARSWRRPS